MKTANKILKSNGIEVSLDLEVKILKSMRDYSRLSKFCSCGGKTKLQVSHCAECGGIMDIADVINNHIRFKNYIAVDDEKKQFQIIDKTIISLLSKRIRICVGNRNETAEVIHGFENMGYQLIK